MKTKIIFYFLLTACIVVFGVTSGTFAQNLSTPEIEEIKSQEEPVVPRAGLLLRLETIRNAIKQKYNSSRPKIDDTLIRIKEKLEQLRAEPEACNP